LKQPKQKIVQDPGKAAPKQRNLHWIIAPEKKTSIREGEIEKDRAIPYLNYTS
jgi:hypothetical protein